MNILVLCTGNSARSIMLECILNRLGAGRVTAWSAGSKPAGKMHPQSLALLGRLGYETGALRSKSWDEFGVPGAPVMDAVITVCGSAAGEECPVWPGSPMRAHWGLEDPAAAPAQAAAAAFEQAYGILLNRAQAFLAQPVDTMKTEELKAHLDACATVS